MIILLRCSISLLIRQSVNCLSPLKSISAYSQNQTEKLLHFALQLLFYWKVLCEIVANVLEYCGLKVYRRMALLPAISDQKQTPLLVIVTGADSGMGRAIVEVAAVRMRAKVVFTVQKRKNGQSLVKRICTQNPNTVQRENLIPLTLDLVSPDSVRCAAEAISTHCTAECSVRLINNAGVLWINNKNLLSNVSEDYVDYHFQVNYLGHFLLTSLLMPCLVKAKSARVVNVSSVAYLLGYPLFENSNDRHTPKLKHFYVPPDKPLKQLKAYGRSKLAILFSTRMMAEKMMGRKKRTDKPVSKVHFYAVHPGGTRTAMINRSPLSRALVRLLGRPTMLSPMMGAQTALHCAFSNEVASQSGLYYE